MKTTNIIALSVIILLLISCNKNKTAITNKNDYDKYLVIKTNDSKKFIESEINFWQTKFDKSPDQFGYLTILSSNYSKLFENTGNVKYLYKAEELLLQNNTAFKYEYVNPIRSLGRNYISQHRFKEALVLANKALAIGEGMKETQKLLFDANMELGNYDDANKNLNYLKTSDDFDYYIRLSKWNDHKGDLKTAITMMEKAKDIAIENENKSLKIWSFSNLGDMNGHAGNIETAYNYYLKTLELEPNNSYALKGIAWIVFSYEKNAAEAKRIIDKISVHHNSPDFYLLKAEIAEFENDNLQKNENLNQYFKMLSSINYGAMYNKYNTLLYADGKKTVQKAVEIAKKEIENRPTPDSYDLLAWSYYKLGEKEKALEIANKFVAGKSFEPELNFHLATIYKANKMEQKIHSIKEDLLASSFELGPNMTDEIIKL